MPFFIPLFLWILTNHNLPQFLFFAMPTAPVAGRPTYRRPDNPLTPWHHAWHKIHIRSVWREEYACEVWTCNGEFPDQWNIWIVYPAATHPKEPSRTMWWYGVWIHHESRLNQSLPPGEHLRDTDWGDRLRQHDENEVDSTGNISSDDSEWGYGSLRDHPRNPRFRRVDNPSS